MSTILSSLLTPNALWILWALVLGGWLVFSWVLHYHWKTYSAHSKTTKRASWIYFTVSLVIFVTTALFIVAL